MDPDPRELSAGYAYPKGKGVAAVAGVLRDGERGPEVWRCTSAPGHRLHIIPSLALQCAQAELERRIQGAKAVFWLAHCVPCWAYWDLGLIAGLSPKNREDAGDAISCLRRGRCPVCGVPFERVKTAVLERQEASVR